MKCPHCNEKLKIEDYVVGNVETYRSPALAATLCCGKPIIARLRTMVVFSAVQTDRTEDDWGNSFVVEPEEVLEKTDDQKKIQAAIDLLNTPMSGTVSDLLRDLEDVLR